MKFAKPPIPFEIVECGEARTASVWKMMRFTMFTSILRVAELFAIYGRSRYHCPQNTLQASQAVRRLDAQTGGFIFLYVGCGEARTSWGMKRFRVFNAFGVREGNL